MSAARRRRPTGNMPPRWLNAAASEPAPPLPTAWRTLRKRARAAPGLVNGIVPNSPQRRASRPTPRRPEFENRARRRHTSARCRPAPSRRRRPPSPAHGPRPRPTRRWWQGADKDRLRLRRSGKISGPNRRQRAERHSQPVEQRDRGGVEMRAAHRGHQALRRHGAHVDRLRRRSKGKPSRRSRG